LFGNVERQLLLRLVTGVTLLTTSTLGDTEDEDSRSVVAALPTLRS